MHILIVDDHPIVRHGLAQLLRSRPGIGSCSEAHSIASALAEHARRKPDAIVLDLSLGEESGLDLLRTLRGSEDATPVFVLSMFEESAHAQRAQRAGAQGFMMKATPPDEVAEAVERVARGEHVFNANASDSSGTAGSDDGSAAPPDVGALTEREIAVLRLLGEGLTSAQIAGLQFRSVKTIDAHRESIKRKLGLRSANELVRYAALWRERH